MEKKFNDLKVNGFLILFVVFAMISHLAYAPEIVAIMLRRQQATAIINS